jgi:hypothetical protein
MAGHSRLKNGVAYARDKRGHDSTHQIQADAPPSTGQAQPTT